MTMTRAIVVHETGGPEQLRWEEVEVGDPGPGEARVRHGAIGLNFIDVYFRPRLHRLAEGPRHEWGVSAMRRTAMIVSPTERGVVSGAARARRGATSSPSEVVPTW